MEIKNTLDKNTLKKLEKELFFEHGMSIKLSMEHFGEFHKALKNNSSIELKNFEISCIKKIFHVKKSNNNYHIEIINPVLAEKIFNFFGDPESRKILLCLMGNKLTISQILENSGVLKSPLYRKIEILLLHGIIFETGKILSNQKRVSLYECIFDEIRTVIEKNQFILEVGISNKIFNSSSIAQMDFF